MVDEVGQFIGKNTQMMLKLQTITENLGVICGGRAWVIVTSQADIDAAIGGMSSRDGQDFSKIGGAFQHACNFPALTHQKLSRNVCW